MTSILQKVLDIPNVLSHLLEINVKGCKKIFYPCVSNMKIIMLDYCTINNYVSNRY